MISTPTTAPTQQAQESWYTTEPQYIDPALFYQPPVPAPQLPPSAPTYNARYVLPYTGAGYSTDVVAPQAPMAMWTSDPTTINPAAMHLNTVPSHTPSTSFTSTFSPISSFNATWTPTPPNTINPVAMHLNPTSTSAPPWSSPPLSQPYVPSPSFSSTTAWSSSASSSRSITSTSLSPATLWELAPAQPSVQTFPGYPLNQVHEGETVDLSEWWQKNGQDFLALLDGRYA